MAQPVSVSPLGKSREELRENISEIYDLIATGQIPISQGAAAIDAIKTEMRRIRDAEYERLSRAKFKKADRDMAELRAMKARLDEADRIAEQRAAAARHHLRSTGVACQRKDTDPRGSATGDGLSGEQNTDAGSPACVAADGGRA